MNQTIEDLKDEIESMEEAIADFDGDVDPEFVNAKREILFSLYIELEKLHEAQTVKSSVK